MKTIANIFLKVIKVIAIIICSILALLTYSILKPILHAVGWLISILTFLSLIYWLLC